MILCGIYPGPNYVFTSLTSDWMKITIIRILCLINSGGAKSGDPFAVPKISSYGLLSWSQRNVSHKKNSVATFGCDSFPQWRFVLDKTYSFITVQMMTDEFRTLKMRMYRMPTWVVFSNQFVILHCDTKIFHCSSTTVSLSCKQWYN